MAPWACSSGACASTCRRTCAGTLAKVRDMGFREVEGAGLWNTRLPTFAPRWTRTDLRCQSAHMSFERLRDDPAGAFAEAKALGATWVVCPWIPQDTPFTREDALKSAEAFNGFAAAAERAGLRFAYHCHGYEFVPSPEGHAVRHAGRGHRSGARDVPGRRVPCEVRRSRPRAADRPLRGARGQPAPQGS